MNETATTLGTLFLLSCCAPPAAADRPSQPSFVDLDNVDQQPLRVAAGEVHVVVFTSQECPIANAYAPTLAGLAAAWREQPVSLFLVHVDPDLTVEQARQHAADYRLPGSILLDPRQHLAQRLGATATPEAVVLTAAGVQYRGRIDDQWRRLGSRAPEASSHDLADAVGAALAGRPVAQPFPAAVGCLLPEPAR